MRDLLITDIAFRPAGPADCAAGLLGGVHFVLDGAVRIDGIKVCRTFDGRMTLKFPDREDRAGVRHPIVRPISKLARLAIECEVIAQLRERGFVP